MNIFDIIIALFALYVVYKGFKRGFVLELSGLLALFLGLFLAYNFYDIVSDDYLSKYVDWSNELLDLSSFLILFIGLSLLINLIGKLITKLLDIAALSLFNRLLGGLFGLLKLGLFLLFINVVIDYTMRLLDRKDLPEFLEVSIVYQISRDIYKSIMPQIFQLLA
ncbi:CvpA family protein [Psychroflexus sp. ALD_RP9]|uniref:CvpA family protein n=1 Tax=Psychroflexus sp. ALD_RP9 TaxID=2777186 RepID=UPI001A8F1CA4|nr:CvpA family protein [Psychroflexus sp. ALD_RP9]QSS97889.1 CvpA family protein [Psychroflexus sp. ALD_RP9]